MNHNKKATEMVVDVNGNVLGSTGIVATCDTSVVMTSIKGSNDVELHANGKHIEPAEIALKWQYPGFGSSVDGELASLWEMQRAVYQ